MSTRNLLKSPPDLLGLLRKPILRLQSDLPIQAGTYSAQGAGVCALCPPGRMQPTSQQLDCIDCPIGYAEICVGFKLLVARRVLSLVSRLAAAAPRVWHISLII